MKQLLGCLFLCLSVWATAQEKEQRRFSASVLAGLNLSQIDGDAAAGFTKPGVNVGGRAGIHIAKRFEVSLELLYSLKGSQCTRCAPAFHYNLHYVEIPVEFNLREWFVTDAKEREFARILFGLGVAYNQLIAGTYKENGVKYDPPIAELRKHNVMGNASLTFFFTRNFGLNLRYSRSLYSLRPRTSGSLIMHLLTLRAVYAF